MIRIFTWLNPVSKFSRRRQSREQRGSIMMLTAVVLMGMIGMLALSIDLGFLFSAKGQFQNGIDAATLAAGTGLRATIESDPNAPEQDTVVRAQAKSYASLNQVPRFQPDPNAEENVTGIGLEDNQIVIDKSTDIPKVVIKSSLPVRLLFAGIFGFDSMNVGATATASLFPVDGGTGTTGSAANLGGGCWRPLFLPDTFYDSSLQPIIVGSGDIMRFPTTAGDYYRSRFAAGSRNAFPFVDSYTGAGVSVTSLRDTQLKADIGTKTVMGQLNLTIKSKFYFIADLSGLPRVDFAPQTVGDIAKFGYCGKIQVGNDIPVYPHNDFTVRDQVRTGLLDLLFQTLNGDSVDVIAENLFSYVKSSSYPGPNTHGAIIPVLLYNPIMWRDEGAATAVTSLRVTNIGFFFLKDVLTNGDLTGYFVREIIAGGTPVAPANMMADSEPGFRRNWLPMSVRLLK